MSKTNKTQHYQRTERPNGFTPKGVYLVPISIITGTKQNKGTKRGIK